MFAVYKTAKHAEGNDSPHMWYFENEDDAKFAVETMNKMRDDTLDKARSVSADQRWGCIPGWEWEARWTYEKYEPKVVTREQFSAEVAEGLQEMKDKGWL